MKAKTEKLVYLSGFLATFDLNSENLDAFTGFSLKIANFAPYIMKLKRIHIIILLCSLWLALPFESLQAQGRDFTVVIDPGHGGRDPGAIGKRGKEKNINLSVALKLGKLIEANCKDVRIIYTRDKDTFVALDQRAQIANNAKADLFISIHTNAVAKGRTIRGTETYTLGLHKTDENLEVAKLENSVILIESD